MFHNSYALNCLDLEYIKEMVLSVLQKPAQSNAGIRVNLHVQNAARKVSLSVLQKELAVSVDA